jgi:hypothetical protein
MSSIHQGRQTSGLLEYSSSSWWQEDLLLPIPTHKMVIIAWWEFSLKSSFGIIGRLRFWKVPKTSWALKLPIYFIECFKRTQSSVWHFRTSRAILGSKRKSQKKRSIHFLKRRKIDRDYKVLLIPIFSKTHLLKMILIAKKSRSSLEYLFKFLGNRRESRQGKQPEPERASGKSARRGSDK